MIDDILITPTKELLEIFLREYSCYQKMDIVKAKILIEDSIRYYRGSFDKRKELSRLQSLENRWYESLDKGSPDYSVYTDKYYFTDLWCCWVIYSRRYLRDILRPNSLSDSESIMNLISSSRSILDLGCGLGYTTASLRQIFNDSHIYATNLRGTYQYYFCEHMSKEYNFKMRGFIFEVDYPIDLIFSSEYFEHIEAPFAHLQEIIDRFNPKYFLIANAFNTCSIGHFNFYKNGSVLVPKEKASKLFNKVMTRNNYRKVKTKLWNDRPSVYIKINSKQTSFFKRN